MITVGFRVVDSSGHLRIIHTLEGSAALDSAWAERLMNQVADDLYPFSGHFEDLDRHILRIYKDGHMEGTLQ